MNAEREKEIVALLNQYDVAGVSFPKAKDELLAKGYTEAEIVFGLYSAPFDGKVNTPQPANPLQKFYEDNPERADRLAKTLLLAQAEDGWGKAAAHTGAAVASPGIQSRSYYEVRAADQLGIPYFTLLFLGIAVLIVAIILDLSRQTTDLIFGIYGIFVSSLFGYKLFQERRRINALRKDLSTSNINNKTPTH